MATDPTSASAPVIPEGSAAEALSTQERLLLAQAVYKVGAVAWPVVSKLLTQHPCCVDRPHNLFTPEACEGAYIALMTSIGQNVPAADAMKPQAKVHLRLAQTFYLARLNELKAEIETYEAGFTSLMGEINSIKSGELDGTIQEELRAALARKYGKKLLDSWVPSPDTVKKAVADGPPKDGEVDPEKTKPTKTTPNAKSKSTQSPEVATTEQIQADEQIEEEGKQDQDEDMQSEDNEPEEKVEVTAPSTPQVVSPPGSDLSPLPSARQEVDQDKLSPAPPTSPSPDGPSSARASKRKASTQPRGAPASKRSGRGRRATSPDPAQSEAASDAHEAEPEQEEDNTGRGRRQSRRGKFTQDSPSASARTKDSSPAVSRRAPSVSSTASATTPAHDDRKSARRSGRGGRGMRDEVVSKNVREHSAAVESVKEEAEDDEEEASEEVESRPARSRRGRLTEDKKVDVDEEDDNEDSRPTRGKRGNKTESGDKKDSKDKDKEDGGRRTTRGTRHTTPPVQEQEDDEAEVDRDRARGRGSKETTGDITPAPTSAAAAAKASRTTRHETPKDAKITQRMLYGLLDTIQGHTHGSVFQNPVRKSDAPDYYDIIKRPMDLKKIRQRIRDGHIAHIDEFERDVLLMFANAMMYNDEGSQVYEMAMEMLKESENHIAHYRTMQHDLGR